jgi:hypothetical protein
LSHSVWKSVPLATAIKEVCASHAKHHVKRVPGTQMCAQAVTTQ